MSAQSDDDYEAQVNGEVPELVEYRRVNREVERLVYTPEVALMFVQGYTVKQVAKMLSVSEGTLRKYKRTMRMDMLLEAEARRVIEHLDERDLGKEKYLGLATAVSGMVKDVQLLRNEPTEIIGSRSAEEVVTRLERAFARRRAVKEDRLLSSAVSVNERGESKTIAEGDDPGRAERS